MHNLHQISYRFINMFLGLYIQINQARMLDLVLYKKYNQYQIVVQKYFIWK